MPIASRGQQSENSQDGELADCNLLQEDFPVWAAARRPSSRRTRAATGRSTHDSSRTRSTTTTTLDGKSAEYFLTMYTPRCNSPQTIIHQQPAFRGSQFAEGFLIVVLPKTAKERRVHVCSHAPTHRGTTAIRVLQPLTPGTDSRVAVEPVPDDPYGSAVLVHAHCC